MERRIDMNFWCRLFGWDEKKWKRIVRRWGIHLTYKGRRHIVRPGTWLWFFIYIGGALVALFGLWAFCVLVIIVFG